MKQVDVVPVLELLPFFGAKHREIPMLLVQAPVESVCLEDLGHLQSKQREIALWTTAPRHPPPSPCQMETNQVFHMDAHHLEERLDHHHPGNAMPRLFDMAAPAALLELVLWHRATASRRRHSCRVSWQGHFLEDRRAALRWSHSSTSVPSTCGQHLRRCAARYSWPWGAYAFCGGSMEVDFQSSQPSPAQVLGWVSSSPHPEGQGRAPSFWGSSPLRCQGSSYRPKHDLGSVSWPLQTFVVDGRRSPQRLGRWAHNPSNPKALQTPFLDQKCLDVVGSDVPWESMHRLRNRWKLASIFRNDPNANRRYVKKYKKNTLT